MTDYTQEQYKYKIKNGEIEILRLKDDNSNTDKECCGCNKDIGSGLYEYRLNHGIYCHYLGIFCKDCINKLFKHDIPKEDEEEPIDPFDTW